MKLRTVLLASTAAIGFGWCDPGALAATVGINVGPEGQYQTIGHAVTAANGDTDLSNHYVINVAPGTYLNDFATVTRPMTIRSDPAFPGQRAILKATTPLPNEKGIILTFASLHVRGLVFEGARIDNSLGGNGAGIRDQQSGPSARLVVEDSIFRNNQEGILQGDDWTRRSPSLILDSSTTAILISTISSTQCISILPPASRSQTVCSAAN
jgi:hypothetical protein